MKKSKIWDSFLPIQANLNSDLVSLDHTWLLANGIHATAPKVLHLLSNEVLPLVKKLHKQLDWFMFLIHDRDSGVPTQYPGEYIHMRFVLKKSGRLDLPLRWVMTKSMKSAADVDGPYPRLIATQSEWVLRLIEALNSDDFVGSEGGQKKHVRGDLFSNVKQVKQFLHYFANMTQMRVA